MASKKNSNRSGQPGSAPLIGPTAQWVLLVVAGILVLIAIFAFGIGEGSGTRTPGGGGHGLGPTIEEPAGPPSRPASPVRFDLPPSV